MAVLRVDDRYRVVLDREFREFLKVRPGDKVLAIPSSEGVLMVPLKGKNFNSSLPGFRYRERAHEAFSLLVQEELSFLDGRIAAASTTMKGLHDKLDKLSPGMVPITRLEHNPFRNFTQTGTFC